MKALKIFSISVTSFALASVSYAKTLNDVVTSFKNMISSATAAVYALAFLAFFWAIAMYLFAKSDDKKSQAVAVMIYSVIAIFVMTSIWGIVNLLQSTLGAENNTADQVDIKLPQIQ